MHLRKILISLTILISISLFAEEQTTKIKVYGFVRSDIFYNSRQNIEAIDGIFHIAPKPIELEANGADKNAVAQLEMLSIATRIGLDISGAPILGAKSSAKIEGDFAGFGTSYYVLRLRHAYAKLNWDKSELLVGQTWHPMFGSVMPTTMSLNAGSPFQPFNRSPQVRFKQNLSTTFSFMAAAVYQMQFMSQGPLGSSSVYLKNALIPNFFLGFENKTTHWTSGAGVDYKTIKLNHESLSSVSAVAYTQYVGAKFQFKAKTVYGENLSDHIMIGGYGVSGTGSDTYTNFKTASGWINGVYGTKIQVGLFLGISQNLGTNNNLLEITPGKYTNYGYGNFDVNNIHLTLDQVYRVTPHVSYNVPNLKFGLEYDFTNATFGSLKASGRVANPYNISNHRLVGSVSYFF